jgi:tRNA(Arg) A34 adenosine deaminase TadA
MKSKSQEYWMAKAIAKAKLNGTPFGAVIVASDESYIEAYNTVKHDGPTAHAEINAIHNISELEYQNPEQLTLYSTVEPCPMCMSAIVWAGIGKVIYGASIDDAAEFGKQLHISSHNIAKLAWYPIQVEAGISRDKCIKLFT